GCPPAWRKNQSEIGTMSSPLSWLRGLKRREQPGPAALRLLHDAGRVLLEKKSGSRERLGLTPGELHIPRSIAVTVDHARPRVAAALALGAVARERDEGSVEVHERARIGHAPTHAPGGGRRQRRGGRRAGAAT